MDRHEFDELTRRIARRATRRRVLGRVLLGAGVAAAIPGISSGDVAARPALCRASGRYCTRASQCCNSTCHLGKRVPRALRNTCACLEPDRSCNGVCRQVLTDVRNCGDCGVVCDAGWTCEDGECVEPAPCSTLDADTLICASSVDGAEVTGSCGLIETRLRVTDSYAPIPCSSDGDCADAYGPCSRDGVTCFCGVGTSIVGAVPYTEASEQFGLPAVCGAITANPDYCTEYLGLPVIMCSEEYGLCGTDSDCCDGRLTCQANQCSSTT